ncbi:fibronectin, type III [Pseudomonas aeruginosa 39016]|nr:fibronectin, type III [Pseudomonas aeruginosa 39016]
MLDVFEELLAEGGLDVLLGDQFVVLARIRRAYAVDPGRPGADVAGPVDQPPAEGQASAGRQRGQRVGVGRVGEQAQGSCVLLAAARGNRLLDLGVGGVRRATGRESPLQADLPRSAGGTQERQRRRRTGLAGDVGQHRVRWDRRHVHGVHSPHARKVLAGVYPTYFHHQFPRTRNPDPLARAPAPLYVVRYRVRCRVPGDGHDRDRQALLDRDVLRDQYACRWILHPGREDADRPRIDDRPVIDRIKLAGLVLDNLKLELLPTWSGHVLDVELHQGQVVVVDRPTALGGRLFTEVGHHRYDASVMTLNRPGFRAPTGQVDSQPRADRDIHISVYGDCSSRYRRDPAAIRTTGKHGVCQSHHLSRPRDESIQANLPDGPTSLQLLSHKRPLPRPLRLTLAGAAESPDRYLPDDPAKLDNRILVEDRLFVCLERIGRVVPRDHRQRMAVSRPRPRIRNHAIVQNLRSGVGVNRVLRHVGVDSDLATIPERQPMKDCGEVLKNGIRLLLLLKIEVASEPRLLTAFPVWHQLVAVLRNAIEGPTVDHALVDALTQTVIGVQHQVIEDPGRIVGISLLEGAVPNAIRGTGAAGKIGPSLRVIVHRNPHDPPAHERRELRKVAPELLGVILHAANGGERKLLVAVDNFSYRSQHHGVLDQRAVRLRRDPPHANRPVPSCRQVDPMRTVVSRNVLPVDKRAEYGLVRSAIRGDIDRVLNAHPIDVPGRILRLQVGPGQAHAYRIRRGVRDGVDVGLRAEQGLAHRNLVAGLRYTFQSLLI